MPTDVDVDHPPVTRVIGLEEHARTADLRDALLRWGGDDTVNKMHSQPGTDARLLEMGQERLDAHGVTVQVLSVTTPG